MVVGAVECEVRSDVIPVCIVSPDSMSYNLFLLPICPTIRARTFVAVTNMYNVIEGLLGKQSLAGRLGRRPVERSPPPAPR